LFPYTTLFRSRSVGDRAPNRLGGGAGGGGAVDRPGSHGDGHRQVGWRPAGGGREGGGQHREYPAAGGDGAGARVDRAGSRGSGPIHERAHRRVRWKMSATTLTILSVLLAVVVVVVLAAALILIRTGLESASK